MPSAKLIKARTSRLSKIGNPDTKWDSTRHVLRVSSPQALLKVIGYLKYYYKGPVLFRGQSKAYPIMVPSIFRDKNSPTHIARNRRAVSRRHEAVCKWLQDNDPFLRGVPAEAKEPLLQHYGINTRWIDLVDNPWIALWFSCHNLESREGERYSYWTYQQRMLNIEGYGLGISTQYVYLYVFNAGKETADHNIDGLWETAGGSHVIDLRRCVPSVYLRPHAQTGWLLTRKGVQDTADCDFGDFVVGVLEVKLEHALSWLGSGSLLSTKALFPPTHYDHGYATMLRRAPDPSSLVGRFAVVEP